MQLQDQLIGRLIGLARATDGNEHLISPSSTQIIVDGLRATHAQQEDLETLLARAREEKKRMVPDCFLCACPCGRTDDYDMEKLRTARQDIRQLKERLLSAVQEIAAKAAPEAEPFLYKALIVLGMDDWGAEELLPVVQEAEEMRK